MCALGTYLFVCLNSMGTIGSTGSIASYPSPIKNISVGAWGGTAAILFNPAGLTLVPSDKAINADWKSTKGTPAPNPDYITPGCPAEGWMLGVDSRLNYNINNNNAGRCVLQSHSRL